MELSQKLTDFINQHRNDNVSCLALTADKHKDIDFQFALRQIAGWQKARTKIPSWANSQGIIFPDHLPMEQCSSEQTAEYKRDIIGKGETMADLTGGFGIDFSFISRNFGKAIYVEKNSDLCKIAKHNFSALNLKNTEINCEDSEKIISTICAEIIYIDPARRDKNGRKTVSISDCTPDLTKIKDELLKSCNAIWVKFSPMLDISQALTELPEICEIHSISTNNESKELLFKLTKEKCNDPLIVCCNITKDGEREILQNKKSEESEAQCLYTEKLMKFLYEPNSSILKGGLYRTVAEKHNVYKLSKNSHLYTSAKLNENFPGRRFEIIASTSLNKNEIKVALAGITKANITVRNFPAQADELRKKLKLKDGGETYIFATTLLKGEKRLIVCRKTIKQEQHH